MLLLALVWVVAISTTRFFEMGDNLGIVPSPICLCKKCVLCLSHFQFLEVTLLFYSTHLGSFFGDRQIDKKFDFC